jgi:hypothetical protein
MASEDVLYYTIRYETDMTSLREAADVVNKIADDAAKAKPIDPIPNAGQVVQDLQKVAEAQEQGVKSLVDLQKEIRNYRAQLKELETIRKLGIDLTAEQEQQEQELKVALKATTMEYNRQTSDLASLSRASSESAKTYNELVAANKAISAEMRNLPLNDTSGRLKELAKQYNANNDRLKEFDKSMGNHQRNVGNYQSALKGVRVNLVGLQGDSAKVAQGVGVMAQAFRGASSAFYAAGGGVRGFSAALAATGIGLLVPILSALIGAFTQFQGVIDISKRALGAFSIAIKSTVENIKLFAVPMQLFLTGQFSAAFDSARVALAKFSEEVGNDVKANDALIIRLQELEALEGNLILTRAKANRQLAQARLDAKDDTKSIAERRAALEEALRIEEEVAAEEMRLAQERADILQAQADLGHSNTADLKELAEARARVEDLATQSIMRQNEAMEKRRSLDMEETKEIEKREAARLRSAQVIADYELQAQIERLQKAGDFEQAFHVEKNARILALQQGFLDAGLEQEEAALRASLQADAEFAEAEQGIAKQTRDFQVEQLQSVANSAMAIGQALFGDTKALAVARAIIDTYASANAAFKDTPGNVVVRALAAGAAIAAGLANVRKIIKTKPGTASAGGGAGAAAKPSFPSMASTGSTTMADSRAASDGRIATGTTTTPATIDTALRSFADRGQTSINVEATVDRKGLALAVRDGEQQIRTEQITFN